MAGIVSFRAETSEFVAEPSPDGQPAEDLTAETLRLRVRQQEILAELGVTALQGTPFPELLDLTARLTAEGLNAEFAKAWPNITAKKDPPADAKAWEDVPDKLEQHFSPDPGAGD